MVTKDSTLTINLVEGDQRRVLEILQTGEIELGPLYDLHLTEELTVIPLTRLTPYVLLAEGHPLAYRQILTPVELAEYSMVLLDAPPSRKYFTEILETQALHRGLRVAPLFLKWFAVWLVIVWDALCLPRIQLRP